MTPIPAPSVACTPPVGIDVRDRRYDRRVRRDRRAPATKRRATFSVHVQGAGEQIDDLQQLLVMIRDFPASMRQSLDVKLVDRRDGARRWRLGRGVRRSEGIHRAGACPVRTQAYDGPRRRPRRTRDPDPHRAALSIAPFFFYSPPRWRGDGSRATGRTCGSYRTAMMYPRLAARLAERDELGRLAAGLAHGQDRRSPPGDVGRRRSRPSRDRRVRRRPGCRRWRGRARDGGADGWTSSVTSWVSGGEAQPSPSARGTPRGRADASRVAARHDLGGKPPPRRRATTWRADPACPDPAPMPLSNSPGD